MFWNNEDLQRQIDRYRDRALQLLDETKEELNTGNILQAGEKLWGAYSAIINCISLRNIRREATSIGAKRHVLTSVIPNLLRDDTRKVIDEALLKIECRSLGKLFERLSGIHRNFYGGGKVYDQSFLVDTIKVSIIVAEKIILDLLNSD